MVLFDKTATKKIPLSQGKYAIVDEADYEMLNQYKWFAKKDRNTFYAVRQIGLPDGKQRNIYMHREILGLKSGDPRQADHRNHNGLNNRRFNIRICNHSQNKQNGHKHKKGSSVFKGVCWSKDHKKWRAYIYNNKKRINLGYFKTEIVAAMAYDLKAAEFFGEFASFNIRMAL